MRRVLLGALVVLLAGCQGHSRYDRLDESAQYHSGAQVRDALQRSGLGCADFRQISRNDRDIGEKDAMEVDTCRVENIDAVIMIWLRIGQAQDWAQSRRTIGCHLAKSLGTSPPVYVDGGRWTIALNSRPVADKIADAIGGQAKFIDCDSPD